MPLKRHLDGIKMVLNNRRWNPKKELREATAGTQAPWADTSKIGLGLVSYHLRHQCHWRLWCRWHCGSVRLQEPFTIFNTQNPLVALQRCNSRKKSPIVAECSDYYKLALLGAIGVAFPPLGYGVYGHLWSFIWDYGRHSIKWYLVLSGIQIISAYCIQIKFICFRSSSTEEDILS